MFLATLSVLVPLAAAPARDPLPMPPPPPGMTRVASQPASDAALPMPPPPRGMKQLSAAEQSALLERADGDDEAPEQSEQIEEESADLEAMRAMEDMAFDPDTREDALILQTVQQLGPNNPLRQRLEDVLADDDHREDSPPELDPVTNLLAFDVSQVKDRYDIPVEMQPLVADYIRFFQGPGRRWFRKWMNRSTRYIPVMQPILEKGGVPKDTVYLAMIESGFSSNAYSWAKAAGPWQFIAGTGRNFGLEDDFWVDERRDPIKSTYAAAKYLKELYGQLGHWYLAWAGYNTGGGRVRRLCERRGTPDFWEISEGRGLAKETKHYVPKLIAAALIAKNPQAFGFKDDEFDFQPPMEFDTVPIPDLTDLGVIARAAGVSEDAIRDLNPELKRWCTPPASEQKPYLLRIPKGRAEQFAENFAKIPKRERMRYVEHKVKRGDTLSVIAARHGSSAEAIMRFNRLKSARSLRINTVLMIPIPTGSAKQIAQTLEREKKAAKREGLSHSSSDEVPAGTKLASSSTSDSASGKGPVKTEVIDGRTRITYGVQDGDTLWAISQKFNCSVDNLVKWNHLPRHGRRLQVGTMLAIWQDRDANPAPSRARTEPASANVQIHELKTGETLWSIAQQFKVTVDQLKSWNGISDHRSLRVGQKLRIVLP